MNNRKYHTFHLTQSAINKVVSNGYPLELVEVHND